jgi:hypothetical protein
VTDATRADLRTVADVNRLLSLRRRILAAAAVWLFRHAADLLVVLPILVLAGAVHGIGMATYPRYVDDPGTYLAQAWSVQYEQRLSPYTYFYDHAPAGWMQLAAWSALTGGFDRHDTAIGFGNECMLIATVVSTALLFVLGRRLGFGRAAAAGAGLLFALCPLEVVYGRWTYLDNLVTPWLLLAFVLAYSPKRTIAAAAGATMSFAMATLTKETALVLAPAFAWALLQNLDRRNRSHLLVTSAFAGGMLMALYPLYAILKGELVPGPGHTSLLGTAAWQLSGRTASGSLLNPDSATAQLFGGWLHIDRWLLLFGLAAIPITVLVRRLRPAALALILQWLMMVRGGYVPFMHVINLMPWSALLIAGACSAIAGNRELAPAGLLRYSAGRARFVRAGIATGLVAVLAGVATLSWAPHLQPMMTSTQQPPLRSATTWLAHNVPRDKVVVAHDSIWTDLVHHYGFDPRPVMIYKLDADPEVRRGIKRIDYLVLPDWYYRIGDADQKYPTLMEARKHSVAVVTFGTGPDQVTIYRVSSHWRPPS